MTATTLIPIGMGLIVLGAGLGSENLRPLRLKVLHVNQKLRIRLQVL